jgi:hypothetical protein
MVPEELTRDTVAPFHKHGRVDNGSTRPGLVQISKGTCFKSLPDIKDLGLSAIRR